MPSRYLVNRDCPHCGEIFRPRKARQKFCSELCAQAGQPRRSVTPIGQWFRNKKGYIVRKELIDGRRVEVKQHRWMMENHLGRKLLPSEDVHHRNGVKDDNRLDNLQLLDHGEHSTITNNSRVYDLRGKKFAITAQDHERRVLSGLMLGYSQAGVRRSQETRDRMSGAQQLRRAQERSARNLK